MPSTSSATSACWGRRWRSARNEVEGYHIFVGGGYGARQDIGREIYPSVAAAECGPVIERMLKGYLAHRADGEETFQDFVKRHPTEKLKELFDAYAAHGTPEPPGPSSRGATATRDLGKGKRVWSEIPRVA